MKNRFKILGIIAVAALLAVGFTACDNRDYRTYESLPDVLQGTWKWEESGSTNHTVSITISGAVVKIQEYGTCDTMKATLEDDDYSYERAHATYFINSFEEQSTPNAFWLYRDPDPVITVTYTPATSSINLGAALGGFDVFKKNVYTWKPNPSFDPDQPDTLDKDAGTSGTNGSEIVDQMTAIGCIDGSTEFKK